MANLRVLVPDSTTNYVKNPSFRHNTDGWQAISTPWGDLYYLYDMFETDRAAGSVNGTLAEPVGGARTVIDTASKISIAGQQIEFASGIAFNSGVWLTSLARVAGKTLLCSVKDGNVNVVSKQFGVGWDADSSGLITDSVELGNDVAFVRVNGGVPILVGTSARSTWYNVCVVMRASGMFYFIKGGVYTSYTLIYVSALGNAAAVPAMRIGVATDSIYSADNIRVPKAIFIPVPLQSDGFSAATTDGAGNAEANGAVGNAYTNVGTWGVAAGVRSCSVLSGADGKSYLPCSSSNVLIDAVCTRSAGVTGIVARYVDSQNYLIAYLDGTNAKLDKVVAGVTTSLISAAVTYGAAFVLRLILDGTSARLFYNNLAVGTVATTPAAGSLNHGLYTTDTGATFDNLIVWARGNEGQYGGLDAL